jgi:site-specific recombinase XerD
LKGAFQVSAAFLSRILGPRPNAEITKHISWHLFRRTFSTLLAENDEDVKTVQSLMRHANINITMNIYTQRRAGLFPEEAS